MGVRNRRPDLNGVLVIDKPYGWTSAKAVAFARRATGGAKVGHAGTLDPLATGVLVLCIGRATKMVESFMNAAKSYHAVIDLSRTSESHDLERDTTVIEVDSPPDRARIDEILLGFVGTIEQVPPAHSAAKMGGKRAYELARKGKLVDAGPPPSVGELSLIRDAGEPDEGATEQVDAPPSLSPKLVRIDAITVLKYEWPMLEIDIDCGRGTYVRSLVRDLAHALGSGGVLTGLIRTRSGAFLIEQAKPASVFDGCIDAEHLLPM